LSTYAGVARPQKLGEIAEGDWDAVLGQEELFGDLDVPVGRQQLGNIVVRLAAVLRQSQVLGALCVRKIRQLFAESLG
jgi:phage gp37-like protein